MRSYTELSKLATLDERFDYLRLDASVGDPTFDDMRWLNQKFYTSTEWRRMRHHVIARDMGMDLGVSDTPIFANPVIHHMNPISVRDIEGGSDNLLNPEYLISTSLMVHNAVHFGDKNLLPRPFVERRPGDHIEWRRLGSHA